MRPKLTAIAFFVSLALFSYSQEMFMQLTVDGPGLDSTFDSTTTIRLGSLGIRDFGGYREIIGDFPGKRTRMLGSDEIASDNFKGLLYEFSPLSGGNNEFSHPNSSLAIKVNSPSNWQLVVSARVTGDPSVVIDQLLFKQDEQTEYIPFTPAPQVIARGNPGVYYLFYDIALRIDLEDKAGIYGLQITYDLVAY
ncbi:MAG: hypothetical protein MUF15_04885 [Acidobacteria bacterium]|jgi:hypothetical protein|nr:hypothetical protein [Acidobacteriota bacterium]